MNRYIKLIENQKIIHKLKLTKIKNKNGNIKAICFAENPFIFKIDNFVIKEINKTGFISIYTKNNYHQKLNLVYQIFSEIENQIINLIFENRFEWCNNMNIARYYFEEAFHQPIKIKNNETIISCHYDNNIDINLIQKLLEEKKFATFTFEYEGFELNESDILPLFKISYIDEKDKNKFSNCLQENSSSEENTMEIDIYPTDVEQLPVPSMNKNKKLESQKLEKVSSDDCINKNNSQSEILENKNVENKSTQNIQNCIIQNKLENSIPNSNLNSNSNSNSNSVNQNENVNESENEYFNSLLKYENDSQSTNNNFTNSNTNCMKNLSNLDLDSSTSFSDYCDLSAKINNLSNANNLNNQNNLNKNIKNTLHNYKKNSSASLNSSVPVYVSNLEFAKIKNSSELNKLYLDTIEDGYESQFEKIKKIKVKK
jgi:hypothetical protein